MAMEHYPMTGQFSRVLTVGNQVSSFEFVYFLFQGMGGKIVGGKLEEETDWKKYLY